MLCTLKTLVPSHFTNRFHNGIMLCQAIGSLPLCAKDRGLICAAKVMPYVLYAAELCCPSDADFGKLRSAVARALWRKRSSRSTDVLLSLLFPVHRNDPKAAWCFRVFAQLRRICLRRPDLISAFRIVWTNYQNRATNGPVTAIFKALKFVGWTWQHFDRFGRNNQPDLRWLPYSKEFFHNEIREAFRKRNLSSANKRKDLAGITSAGGVNRDNLFFGYFPSHSCRWTSLRS